MLDVAHLVGDDRLELALVEPLQQAARHPDVGAAPGAPEGEGVWGGVVDEPQGDQRDASLPAAGGDDPTQRQPGGVAVPVMGITWAGTSERISLGPTAYCTSTRHSAMATGTQIGKWSSTTAATPIATTSPSMKVSAGSDLRRTKLMVTNPSGCSTADAARESRGKADAVACGGSLLRLIERHRGGHQLSTTRQAPPGARRRHRRPGLAGPQDRSGRTRLGCGTLEPGRSADLMVPTDDYLTCDEDAIPRLRADLTLVGGVPVHASGPFQGLAPP